MTRRQRKSPKKKKDHNEEPSVYERFRDERIRENRERMEKLLDLSRNFNSNFSHQNRPKRKYTKRPSFLSFNTPSRRSSRLAAVKISHARELRLEESGKLLESFDDPFPEIYTEDHEKLLGDCNNQWVLFVDGFDADGQRVYDNYIGKTCHQCRKLSDIVAIVASVDPWKGRYAGIAYTQGMEKMFLNRRKTQIGYARFVEESATAVDVDIQKGGCLFVYYMLRLRNLGSSRWHITLSKPVTLRENKLNWNPPLKLC